MTNRLHSSLFHPVLRQYQELNTRITASNLMYPVFIVSELDAKIEIPSMPGICRYGLKQLIKMLEPLVDKGLSSVLLFGVIDPDFKDPQAVNAISKKNPVLAAISCIKTAFPDLLIACDVCLCGFTDHGHCGILNSKGELDNSASIEKIANLAVRYAKAGCHVVAPSDMMDGRIEAIKEKLDESNLGGVVSVLSYTAKFASKFYGPFRDAADSAPAFGDRRSYQLPPGSKGMATRAVSRDVEEGADMLMVKPGLAYLDIIQDVKLNNPEYPLFAYQVSGEFAMLIHAADKGVFDLKDAVMETLTSMRRAGADVIVTYFVPQLLLNWLNDTQN